MSETEFKERVLAELAEMKADIKELMSLKERIAVVETKAVLFGGMAGLIAAAVIAKVLE